MSFCPSTRVRKNIAFLILLNESLSQEQKRQLIITATTSQLLTVCEIVKNVMYGVLKLNLKYKKELSSYENIFQKLINRSTSNQTKKKKFLKYFSQFVKLISPISLLKK